MRPLLLLLWLWALCNACNWSVSAVTASPSSDAAASAAATAAARFSHPLTVHVPLSRAAGANRKMVAAARAGNKHYQRLMRANEHGARLQREERRRLALRPLSKRQRQRMRSFAAPDPSFSPSTDALLVGCPMADFVLELRVGGQLFTLIADTGSATLAVAGDRCSNCGAVSPRWNQSAAVALGASDQQAQVSAFYGGHTGWLGQSWMDSVALEDDSADTQAVSMRVAVITQQSTLGFDQTGAASSRAGAFFFVDRCFDSPNRESWSFMQGIVGLGMTALAAPGSEAFIDRFFAGHPGMPRNFAMRMCAQQGSIWFGGVDRTSFVPSPMRASELEANSSLAPYVGESGLLYTPLGDANYYNVFPSTVYIGNRSLGFVSGDWPRPNIVDSGTTLLHLPLLVYAALVKALLADEHFSKLFRSQPDDNFFDHPSAYCEAPTNYTDWPALQDLLPTFSIQFANGLVLTMDGMGSYLLPCSNAYRVFTPGISPYAGGMIGGWPLLNQFLAVHDLANMQMGFAVVANCQPTSKPFLRANVSFATVPECDPDSGSSCVIDCAAGMFCTTASSVPQPCPLAHECPAGSRAPRPCSPGRYCPQMQLALGIPCPSGHYEPNPGQIGCSGTCGTFWHMNDAGSTHCDGWSAGAWIVFIVGPLVLLATVAACWLCGACGNRKANCCALEGEQELAAARTKREADGPAQRNGQRRPEGGWAANAPGGALAGVLGTTALMSDGGAATPKPLSPSPASPAPQLASPSQPQVDTGADTQKDKDAQRAAAEAAMAAAAAASTTKAAESASHKRQQESMRRREEARNREALKPYSPPSASASIAPPQQNFPVETTSAAESAAPAPASPATPFRIQSAPMLAAPPETLMVPQRIRVPALASLAPLSPSSASSPADRHARLQARRMLEDSHARIRDEIVRRMLRGLRALILYKPTPASQQRDAEAAAEALTSFQLDLSLYEAFLSSALHSALHLHPSAPGPPVIELLSLNLSRGLPDGITDFSVALEAPVLRVAQQQWAAFRAMVASVPPQARSGLSALLSSVRAQHTRAEGRVVANAVIAHAVQVEFLHAAQSWYDRTVRSEGVVMPPTHNTYRRAHVPLYPEEEPAAAAASSPSSRRIAAPEERPLDVAPLSPMRHSPAPVPAPRSPPPARSSAVVALPPLSGAYVDAEPVEPMLLVPLPRLPPQPFDRPASRVMPLQPLYASPIRQSAAPSEDWLASASAPGAFSHPGAVEEDDDPMAPASPFPRSPLSLSRPFNESVGSPTRMPPGDAAAAAAAESSSPRRGAPLPPVPARPVLPAASSYRPQSRPSPPAVYRPPSIQAATPYSRAFASSPPVAVSAPLSSYGNRGAAAAASPLRRRERTPTPPPPRYRARSRSRSRSRSSSRSPSDSRRGRDRRPRSRARSRSRSPSRSRSRSPGDRRRDRDRDRDRDRNRGRSGGRERRSSRERRRDRPRSRSRSQSPPRRTPHSIPRHRSRSASASRSRSHSRSRSRSRSRSPSRSRSASPARQSQFHVELR